ncbi:hypothetical protein GP486_004697 [Trichoglossum hirsutum]|uniref:Uncharacterized protein n=1 Tax=Trichoglossum hirsutum TaxID=265104 RepID=A0A9P8LAT2_9PEZI|nr:hypothetical protein GP486_004697 [Trichoglossum hirsutum]
MFALNDRQKDIIRNYPIGGGLEGFREYYSGFVAKAPSTPSFSDIAHSASTDRGAERLIMKLLHTLQGLDAPEELPPHRGSSRKSLNLDINDLYGRFPERVNAEAIAILLKHAIAKPVDEESLWSAVYGAVHEVSSFLTTPTRKKSYFLTPRDDFPLHLQNDWNREFFDDALIGLQEQMRDCLKDKTPYYAKTLVFVQSSGMGKSRLADTFGRTCPMINFVLRDTEDGYPPGDEEIVSFARKELDDHDYKTIFDSPLKKKSLLGERGQAVREFSAKRVAIIWSHCIAVGLLRASLRKFNTWIEMQDTTDELQDIAARRHELMAPTNGERSSVRAEFCREVVLEASKIAHELAMDPEWRKCFDSERPSAVREAIIESAKISPLLKDTQRLMDNLRKFGGQNDTNPLLVLVLDEASSLFTSPYQKEVNIGRYVAFNRIFSILKAHPMWFFILSTESKIEYLLPPNRMTRTEREGADYSNRPSARNPGEDPYPEPTLRLFPPFVALRLDVEDKRLMRSPKERAIELSKPMADFSKPEHMALFGRPLWHAYKNPDMMSRMARLKLVGGRESATFIPEDGDHVFAALSFRLSLDVCLENPITLPFVRRAVNSHMRVVMSMNQPTGALCTFTPSEPVVAKAAMELLCYEENWSNSIGTFARHLLQRGVIEKGLKGELYSRLVLILAHDWLRSGKSLVEASPKFMPTFTVDEFLTSLYAGEYHELIREIPSEILEARMNFTHFVSTSEHLSPAVVPELCHDLLRRSAALQLAPTQPTYDKLIPIYFGKVDEPFDTSQWGVIMIQDKNKTVATSIRSVFKEEFTMITQKTGYPSKRPKIQETSRESADKKCERPIGEKDMFIFHGIKKPILFLMFDMGVSPVTSPPLEVSYSNYTNPRVWAIHSRGHSRSVFGCLESMDPLGHCETFFSSTIVAAGKYVDIARENMAFEKLARAFRYPTVDKASEGGHTVETGHRGQDAMDGDGEIRMEET